MLASLNMETEYSNAMLRTPEEETDCFDFEAIQLLASFEDEGIDDAGAWQQQKQQHMTNHPSLPVMMINPDVYPADISTSHSINSIKTSCTPLEERTYWDCKPWAMMNIESDESVPCTPYTPYTPYTAAYSSVFTALPPHLSSENIYPNLETHGSQLMDRKHSKGMKRVRMEREQRVSLRVSDIDEDEARRCQIPTPVEEDAEPVTLSRVVTHTRRRKDDGWIDDHSPVSILEDLQSNDVIWNKLKDMKKKGIYKCGHCSDIFATLLQLAGHMDENRIKRRFRCPFNDCPWSIMGLPRRAEVRRHCAAQHDCIVDTETLENMLLSSPSQSPHSDTLQFAQAGKFQCPSPICPKVFKRRDACLRHEKLVHQNPESRFNRRVERLRVKYRIDDCEELRKLLAQQPTRRS